MKKAKPPTPPVVAAYEKLREKGEHYASPIEVLEAAGYEVVNDMEVPTGHMVIVVGGAS